MKASERKMEGREGYARGFFYTKEYERGVNERGEETDDSHQSGKKQRMNVSFGKITFWNDRENSE